jgi:hypothetical protein
MLALANTHFRVLAISKMRLILCELRNLAEVREQVIKKRLVYICEWLPPDSGLE